MKLQSLGRPPPDFTKSWRLPYMIWFSLLILVVAVLSGATASVVGFGIGSMLTPLLASRFDASVAVAAVTLPHALATAVRCWRLRANIDRNVLFRFGLLSAAGALAGALVYTRLGPSTLTAIQCRHDARVQADGGGIVPTASHRPTDGRPSRGGRGAAVAPRPPCRRPQPTPTCR